MDNNEELRKDIEKFKKEYEEEKIKYAHFEDYLNNGNLVDAYKVFQTCPDIVDHMTFPIMMDAYSSFARFLNQEQADLFFSALKKRFEGVRSAPKIDGLICLTFDTDAEGGDLEKGIQRFIRKRQEGRDRQYGRGEL